MICLRKLSIPLTALGFLLFPKFVAVAQEPIRAVAFSSSLSIENALDYNFFFNPVTNDSGEVAFTAHRRLSATLTLERALFSEADGNGLSIISERGDAVPGSLVNDFSDFGVVSLSNSGTVGFRAGITNTGFSSPTAVVAKPSGGPLNVIAKNGDSPPLSPDARLFTFSDVKFDSDGSAAFLGSTHFEGALSTSRTRAYAQDNEGQLTVLAEFDSQVPGLESGVKFGLSNSSLYAHSNGRTLFSSALTGPGIDSTNVRGLFVADDNELQLVAQRGDTVSGLGAIEVIRDSVLSAEGNYSLQAEVGDPLGSNSISTILTNSDEGSLQLVAYEGMSLPPIGSEATVEALNVLGISRQQKTVFEADFLVNDSVSSGIFANDNLSTDPEILALIGDNAPGTNANFLGFIDAIVNDAGKLAFTAALTGDDVVSGNRTAIFAEDNSGNLRLIARTGDEVNISQDPNNPIYRPIVELSFDRNGFSNNGHLAFRANFETSNFSGNRHGIFVSSVAAIPEPNSVLLVTVGLTALLVPRRRKTFDKKPNMPAKNSC